LVVLSLKAQNCSADSVSDNSWVLTSILKAPRTVNNLPDDFVRHDVWFCIVMLVDAVLGSREIRRAGVWDLEWANPGPIMANLGFLEGRADVDAK
jgi:hypothetical protein